jgi:predicted RNA-binding Zn-ribbon protein involved in translation (DUF1610 family)
VIRVLVACEFSGVVRDAFAARGHFAVSCDLIDTQNPGPHHVGDVRALLRFSWDLMIAHPPCQYLSASGLHWNKRIPGRAYQTELALDFVRELLDAPIPRIALENPIGCIGTRIRPADQIIQPWQFGADASKATCLWLKDLPPLKPTQIVKPRLVCCGAVLPKNAVKYGCPNCNGEKRARRRWANQTDSGQNRLGPSPTRAADRAVTYAGIAEAMAEQWGSA